MAHTSMLTDDKKYYLNNERIQSDFLSIIVLISTPLVSRLNPYDLDDIIYFISLTEILFSLFAYRRPIMYWHNPYQSAIY